MSIPCSPELLQSALTGDLPPEREELLQRHLEECKTCAAALESMAGDAELWQEAAAMFAAGDLDEVIGASRAGDAEWSDADFSVEHLEPSDEPGVLGRLGGYDVLEIIGRGGMGVVLKGYDPELKRCVAIKILSPQLAHSSLAKKRFAREAQAAAAVVHPNVLAIHQVQPGGRLPFLVMPLVAGESLAQRLAARGRLELDEVLRIGMQAAAALAAAHEQGLVHRDVKPANILLEKGVERAVLTDFGLARAADDVSMTRWGIIAGTPQYMSPEQAQGEAVDGRSDLFSLGCVLYEMASGVSPFKADTTLATLRRLIDDPPPSLSALNPELPPWFIGIVQRLLEKDPARRFASAKEVSELLEGCLAHLQQPANSPLPLGEGQGVRAGSQREEKGDAQKGDAETGRPEQACAVPAKASLDAAPASCPLVPGERQGAKAAMPRKRLILGTLAMLSLIGISLFAVGVVATAPPDISGRWQGEDWGLVILSRKNAGEYDGTFRNPQSAQVGELHLHWSRVERQFVGTWSEGKQRHGEISARRLADEIRGSLSTDQDSRPNTPHLHDLSWTRAFKPIPPEAARRLAAMKAAQRSFEEAADRGEGVSDPEKLESLFNEANGNSMALAELLRDTEAGPLIKKLDEFSHSAMNFGKNSDQATLDRLREQSADLSRKIEEAVARQQPWVMPAVEFRIVPNPPDSDRRPKYPEFIENTKSPFAAAAVKELAEKGPQEAEVPGSEYRWFPLPVPSELDVHLGLVGEYRGHKYLLLCDRQPYALLPKSEGADAWHVETAYETGEGVERSVEIQLSPRGGSLLYELTKANLGNRLAVVVRGKIVTDPVLVSAIGRNLRVAGESVGEVARALQPERVAAGKMPSAAAPHVVTVDVSANPGGPWVAKVPQGSMELVGVADCPLTISSRWWKPDGSDAKIGPYMGWPSNKNPFLPPSWLTTAKRLPAFLIRAKGMLTGEVGLTNVQTEPVGKWSVAGVLDAHGSDVPDHELFFAELPGSTHDATLRFAVPAREYAEVIPFVLPQAGADTQSASLAGQTWKVTLKRSDLKSAGDDSACISAKVEGPTDGWETQLVALERGGRKREARCNPPGGTIIFNGLPLSSIVGFSLQVRPYTTVEFTHVAVQPREVAPQAKGSATASAADDGSRIVSKPPFQARLPNGVTVELLGVAEHPSKGRPWWRPDGSPLPERPYDELGFERLSANSYSTPMSPYGREFAVRLKNLPAGGFADFWEFDPYDPQGSWSKGSPTCRDGRGVNDIRPIAASVPAASRTITVRYGLAAGPWKTVTKSSGGISAVGIMGQGIVFADPYEKDGRVVITVTHTVTDTAKDPQVRVVAVGRDGRERTPDHEVTGGASGVRQLTVEFAKTSLCDVTAYRFQTRPYQRIEFRDVSLYAGEKTGVQVVAPAADETRKPGVEKKENGGKENSLPQSSLMGEAFYNPDLAAAERFVDLLAEGDFDKATADFGDAMKKAMPPADLKKLWDGLSAEAGKFKGRGPSRTENVPGAVLVYVSANWEEHRKLEFKLAFDREGRISGLWLRPETTAGPAASWQSAQSAVSQLAGSPQVLRTLPTARVIAAGFAKPLEPWAWQELDKRPLTAAEATQIVDGVTQWLRREHPAGSPQKLFWLDDFLNHLAEHGLVTETQKIRLVQAMHGDLRGETLLRRREGVQNLNVNLECRCPFEDNLLGLTMMNELQSATVDGRPLKLLTNFTRQWNTSNLMTAWQLPALAPGKYLLKVNVLSALVAASDMTGLDANAPSADWPPAKKRWTRTAEMELVVHPRDAVIVAQTQDPALDPVRSGGLAVQPPVILRPKGTGDQAALNITVNYGKLPVPVSFAVTLRIAGQKVPCGQFSAARRSDNSTMTQTLTTDLVRPDATVRDVDVILTPDAKAVDEVAAIDRIWGKEAVFHNVPLKRLDLDKTGKGPKENVAGVVSDPEPLSGQQANDAGVARFDGTIVPRLWTKPIPNIQTSSAVNGNASKTAATPPSRPGCEAASKAAQARIAFKATVR